MGVCGSKTVKGSALNSISIHKRPIDEEWSMVVNSKRTAVPRLQPVHTNPLHARRKGAWQLSSNALRSSSALDTFSASGQLEYSGQGEGMREGVAA